MNTLAAQKLLRLVADRLQDPEFVAQFANARAVNLQTVASNEHIWTLSLHEVCPDDVATAGELVILNDRPTNTDRRLN